MYTFNKKIIYATIILLLILGGVAVWFFFAGSEDGEPRDSFFGSGSPFGNPSGGGGFGSGGSRDDRNESGESIVPRLFQITNAPVAGAAAFAEERGEGDRATTTPFVRYMERASGNVLEVSFPRFETRRLTNTTIPRVHEALWGENGDTVIARYLDEDGQTIKTFVGNINEPDISSEVGTIEGSFLPDNIPHITTSADKTDVTYLSTDNEGVSVVQTTLANPHDATAIFSFPFTDWLLSQTNEVFLTTKPSGVVAGYAYMLNSGLEKVVGDIAGLTILPSPQSSFVLHTAEAGGLALEMINITENERRSVPFSTLPEKCVWTTDETRVYCGVPQDPPAATYPDAWYQGTVLFNDTIESFSTETNVPSSVSSLEQAGEPIDITHPFLGPNEEYLFFTNKHDGTLWVYRLKEREDSPSGE